MEVNKLEADDSNVLEGREAIEPQGKLALWGGLPVIKMMAGNEPIARAILENNPPRGLEDLPPGLIVCGAGCLAGLFLLGPRLIGSVVNRLGSRESGEELITLDVVEYKGREKQVAGHGAGIYLLKDTETGEIERVEGGKFIPAKTTSEPKGRRVHKRDEGVKNVGKITKSRWKK